MGFYCWGWWVLTAGGWWAFPAGGWWVFIAVGCWGFIIAGADNLNINSPSPAGGFQGTPGPFSLFFFWRKSVFLGTFCCFPAKDPETCKKIKKTGKICRKLQTFPQENRISSGKKIWKKEADFWPGGVREGADVKTKGLLFPHRGRKFGQTSGQKSRQKFGQQKLAKI